MFAIRYYGHLLLRADGINQGGLPCVDACRLHELPDTPGAIAKYLMSDKTDRDKGELFDDMYACWAAEKQKVTLEAQDYDRKYHAALDAYELKIKERDLLIASIGKDERTAIVQKMYSAEELSIKVDVNGGCADVTACPDFCTYEVIDHDNEEGL